MCKHVCEMIAKWFLLFQHVHVQYTVRIYVYCTPRYASSSTDRFVKIYISSSIDITHVCQVIDGYKTQKRRLNVHGLFI